MVDQLKDILTDIKNMQAFLCNTEAKINALVSTLGSNENTSGLQNLDSEKSNPKIKSLKSFESHDKTHKVCEAITNEPIMTVTGKKHLLPRKEDQNLSKHKTVSSTQDTSIQKPDFISETKNTLDNQHLSCKPVRDCNNLVSESEETLTSDIFSTNSNILKVQKTLNFFKTTVLWQKI